MAEKNLNIDEQAMKKKEGELETALTTYKNFGASPFDQEIGSVESMNTDFLAKFITMLENLNSNNTKTIETIEEIGELAGEIVDTFIDIDHTASSSIEYKEE
jgi:hypothetical protein